MRVQSLVGGRITKLTLRYAFLANLGQIGNSHLFILWASVFPMCINSTYCLTKFQYGQCFILFFLIYLYLLNASTITDPLIITNVSLWNQYTNIHFYISDVSTEIISHREQITYVLCWTSEFQTCFHCSGLFFSWSSLAQWPSPRFAVYFYLFID